MDRRNFFTQLITAKPQAHQQVVQRTAASVATTTLAPYAGPWTVREAGHLLRRTTFGPTMAQLHDAVADGLSATLGALFAPTPPPPPPVYYNYNNDPGAANGETWVGVPAPVPAPVGLAGARRRSLTAWQIGLMMNGGVSIHEKMVLFWHNHFVVSNINNALFGYQYFDILRRHALGDFRAMVEEMTIAPAMLVYLNGNENTRQAPNENYARELLELFTVGRGDVAAPGDYTHYTEDDVVAMAKALTGWVARANPDGTVNGLYVNNRHDTGSKQLSHRFGHAVIENAGDQEYKIVVDHILQQDEVARFLSRQLHIWFIGANIDPIVEANVIEPMAQILRDNDYRIQPALEALLGSEYFFLADHQGCMISHPLDYLFRIVNTFQMGSNADLLQQYRFWDRIYQRAGEQEMLIMGLPSVAGWNAFYQSPQYYEFWINAVTLVKRQEAAAEFMNGFLVGGARWQVDLLDVIAQIPDNTDPNALLQGIATRLLPEPFSEAQVTFLKEVLIPGLPDYEWGIEYGEYLQNPTDVALRNAILTKLQSLFGTIVKMPEFYLI